MVPLLALAAFAAGLLDAIAGGGGIITVPALLAAGLDPAAALATNKGQAVFGTSASMASYVRHGLVDRERAPWSFAFAAAGALAGAALVLWLDPARLRPLVLALLVLASLRRVREEAGSHGGERPARAGLFRGGRRRGAGAGRL